MNKALAIAGLLLCSGHAMGQDFNIDLDATSGASAGGPATNWDGAADSSGQWNLITANSLTTTALKNIYGWDTSATFTKPSGGVTWGAQSDGGTTGNVEKLMDDGAWLNASGTLTMTLNGLEAGTYAVFVYAGKANADSNRAGVTTVPTVSAFQSVGGNLTNSLLPLETHAVHIAPVGSGGTLTIKVSDTALGLAVCNGIQIRKLDTNERLRMYVDDSNAGVQEGTAWGKEFKSLQTALLAAQAIGGKYSEIWVRQGFYYPTTGSDRSATFTIPDKLKMYGGFGGTEDDLSDRTDPWFYITAMHGGIGGSSATDNSYNVMTCTSLTNETVVDGFTVAGGRASGSGDDARGGGALLNNSSLIFRNVKFISNFSGINGGAVHSTGGSPVFANCLFYNNDSDGSGAGFYHHTSGTPIFHNVEFIGNIAAAGGAVGLNFAPAEFVNCSFVGNDTNFGEGGAIRSGGDDGDDLRLTNCTVAHNDAAGSAGGIYISTGADVLLYNSIVWGNTDGVGSGAEARNVSAFAAHGSGKSYNSTTVEGLSANPQFVDPNGGDNVLGTTDDDVRLQNDSPCIDAGNNNFIPDDTYNLDGDNDVFELIPIDLAGEERQVDDPFTSDTGFGTGPIIDRGAFEVQVCLADYNRDGFLSGDDYDAFVEDFENGNIAADFNGDNFVNGDDFDLYSIAFDAGC